MYLFKAIFDWICSDIYLVIFIQSYKLIHLYLFWSICDWICSHLYVIIFVQKCCDWTCLELYVIRFVQLCVIEFAHSYPWLSMLGFICDYFCFELHVNVFNGEVYNSFRAMRTIHYIASLTSTLSWCTLNNNVLGPKFCSCRNWEGEGFI